MLIYFLATAEIIHVALTGMGVPVLPSPERAARAFGAMVEYTWLKRKIIQ